jgi:hypothetical protein
MVGNLKGELGSVSVVSTDPVGLKKKIREAVAGQLKRFTLNEPLVYAALVPLNIPSIVVHAVGIHAPRLFALKDVAPLNILDIFTILDTSQVEMS